MNFRLKKLKNIKLVHLAALLAAGVMILVLADFGFGGGEKDTSENAGGTAKEEAADVGESETQLAEIIGKIKGVSGVSVFITYENDGVKRAGYNTKESTSDGGDNDTKSRESTAVMKRQSSSEEPFISEQTRPQVRGVLIVARGVDNPQVSAEITEAVSAVLGVAVHRVKVLPSD